MKNLTKHYAIYPDKASPNQFMIDIYEEADDLHSFERMTTNLAGLSEVIRKFEQAGYIADSIEFNLC